MLAIAVEDLTFQYPGAPKKALDGLSFTVEKGSFHGLLGPNGAGKSTFLHLLMGLFPAASGKLLYKNKPLDRKSRQTIGFAPQDIALYPTLTARENLHFFAGIAGIKTVSEATHAAAFDMGLTEVLDQRVEEFSGGMKRRLNLAVSLLNDPDLLVLDEPTVGVDPQSRRAIIELLKERHHQGKTIIYATHYMEEVEQNCEQVTIIDHGKVIAAGKTSELTNTDAKRIVVEFDQRPRPHLLQELKAFASADMRTLATGRVLFSTHRPDRAWQGVSEVAERFQVKIQHFEMRDYTLEEKFIDLTGRELRD